VRSTGVPGGVAQLEQLARQRDCLPEVHRKRPLSVGSQTQTAHLLSLEIGCIACRRGLGHHPYTVPGLGLPLALDSYHSMAILISLYYVV
jgi:hypothetical protein